MEKIIGILWREEGISREAFNDRLVQHCAPALTPQVRALTFNLQDERVQEGTSPAFASTDPAIEAFVQMWVDSAGAAVGKVAEILSGCCERHALYLVCEATPIPNELHPAQEGAVTAGFSQMVALGLPPRLSWEEWRHNWQGLHTPVAIETQSNFEYHQNLVVRPLTDGALAYVAIVEECFPAAARQDEAVYCDAEGDPEKLARNKALMGESCARFIDFDRIDCVPTSQHVVKLPKGDRNAR